MTRQMLDREGYDVLTAENGHEGIRIYEEEPVDIIITDIIMPDKEGIETIVELRRTDPQVKIIAISGGGKLTPGSYLFAAKKFGALRSLTKPFTRIELIDAINELMD